MLQEMTIPPDEFVQKKACFLQSEALSNRNFSLSMVLSGNGAIENPFYVHTISGQTHLSPQTAHNGLLPSTNILSNSLFPIILSCDDGLGPSLRNRRISGKGGEEGMDTSKNQELDVWEYDTEGGDAWDIKARLFLFQLLELVV